MITMTAIREKDGGVTLIELMIVLVIAALLVAGVYSLFITQHRSYAVQDQVAGAQQDARAALNIMARDIRMAGFAVGAGSSSGFTDGTTSSTIPSMPAGDTYQYAVEPRNSATASDTLTAVLGAVELGTVSGVLGNSVTLSSAAPTGTPATTIPVAFDLLPGRLYKGTVSGATITISSTGFPSGGSTIIGGMAYWVHAITYSVDADGELNRNENTGAGNQPLAGDKINTFVEDLQFAYQVVGNAAWYNSPANFPAGRTAADIRMVRINITVRTAVQDATVQNAPPSAQFRQPPLEDHIAIASLQGPDGFRRRVYQTVVKVRNLQ